MADKIFGFRENKDKVEILIVLEHSKSGTIHSLTGFGETTGFVTCTFKATADFVAGDTIQIDGVGYTVQLSNGETADNNLFVNGAVVEIIVDTEGKKVNFKAGGGKKIEPATVTLDTSQTSYTIPKGQHDGAGKVQIILEEKTVTPNEQAQVITPTNEKVLSKVTVNAAPALQYYYYTTGGYTTHYKEIPNTAGKSGVLVVTLGELNQGNDPWSSMSVTRQTSKTGIVNDHVGNDGKARFMAIRFTFSAGSGNIVLSFASGLQQGNTKVVCSYVTY